MKLPRQVAPALLGAAGGALILAIIGFTWFGWVTGSTAEKMAKDRADAAVIAALTPVCVEKFKQSADAAKHLEDLKKIQFTWEKGAFMEKGGWATFPGTDKPNSGVAQECAEAVSNQKL